MRHLLSQAEDELNRIAHITRQSLGFYRETSSPAHFKPSAIVREVTEFYAARARPRESSSPSMPTPTEKCSALPGNSPDPLQSDRQQPRRLPQRSHHSHRGKISDRSSQPRALRRSHHRRRHRPRHSTPKSRKHLRAFLHDQERHRHRPRPLGLTRTRQKTRWHHFAFARAHPIQAAAPSFQSSCPIRQVWATSTRSTKGRYDARAKQRRDQLRFLKIQAPLAHRIQRMRGALGMERATQSHPATASVFNVRKIAGSFPATADTMLIDTRLTDEHHASSRVFRVYRPTPRALPRNLRRISLCTLGPRHVLPRRRAALRTSAPANSSSSNRELSTAHRSSSRSPSSSSLSTHLDAIRRTSSSSIHPTAHQRASFKASACTEELYLPAKSALNPYHADIANSRRRGILTPNMIAEIIAAGSEMLTPSGRTPTPSTSPTASTTSASRRLQDHRRRQPRSTSPAPPASPSPAPTSSSSRAASAPPKTTSPAKPPQPHLASACIRDNAILAALYKRFAARQHGHAAQQCEAGRRPRWRRSPRQHKRQRSRPVPRHNCLRSSSNSGEPVRKIVILLPGPPKELKPLFDNAVKPRLAAPFPPRTSPSASSAWRSSRSHRSTPAPLPSTSSTQTSRPPSSPAPARSSSTSSAPNPPSPKPQPASTSSPRRSKPEMDDAIFSSHGESLEEVVLLMLGLRHLTLATAESCTGGLLAERLTAVPGSSRYFLGGAVVYADHLKTTLRRRPRRTVATHGPVSDPKSPAPSPKASAPAPAPHSASASPASPAPAPARPAPTRTSPSASSTSPLADGARHPGQGASTSPATANASAGGPAQHALELIRHHLL